MTDPADEKAREILNGRQDYETLRRNIAQAILDARAEEKGCIELLRKAILEAANVLDQTVYESKADAKAAGDVALMLRSRSALAIRSPKP